MEEQKQQSVEERLGGESIKLLCIPCSLGIELRNYIKRLDTTQLKNPLAQIQTWIHTAANLHKECESDGCACKSNHEELATEAWRAFYDKGTVSAKKD